MRSLLGESVFGRRASTIFFVSIWIVMLLCIPPAASLLNAEVAVESSGVISYVGIRPLHVEGRYIKDSLGNIVYLRGVNRGQFHSEPTGAWGAWYSYQPDDVDSELDAMQSWGINCLRLYVAVEWWVNNSSGNTPTGTITHRNAIKDVIEKAAERGIYVIYCPWCVYRMERESLPYPPYSNHSEIIENQAAFVNYWASVASELDGYSNVIFELWNEPHGDDAARDSWFGVAQQCIDAIRGVGNKIIVVQWGYAEYYGNSPYFYWIEDYPLTGGNLIYSTHLYRTWGHLGGGATGPYDYDTIKNRLTTMHYPYIGETLNKVLWIGEIGANVWWDQPKHPPERWEEEKAYLNNCLQLFNEWGLGYAVWEWWIGRQWDILSTSPWSENILPNEAGQILIDAITAGASP